MKFLDLLENNDDNSILKRGKLIYDNLRKGHIIYSEENYPDWDLEPLKVSYTLPEYSMVDVYKGFPRVTFYDEVEYSVPDGYYEENDLSFDNFNEEHWIQDIQEKFWKKYRVILVDDNFGEFLDFRSYLRDI